MRNPNHKRLSANNRPAYIQRLETKIGKVSPRIHNLRFVAAYPIEPSRAQATNPKDTDINDLSDGVKYARVSNYGPVSR
jgi:hypothetical protein